MKRLFLVFLSLINIVGFSQIDTKIIQEKVVNKIKNYNPTDLVPYSQKRKKWALMDVKSRKVITDFVLPVYGTFNPNFEIVGNQEIVRISPDYKISVRKNINDIGYDLDVFKTDRLGFEIDEERNSDFHHGDYKNVYYAVIPKKEGKILINPNGEEQTGFYFRNIEILPYKDKNGVPIFYVEDFEGNKGLISLLGEKILYGELMHNTLNDVLGYSVQGDKHYVGKFEKSGVVDLTTQEWLIKPQGKYEIYAAIYTSMEKIEKSNAADREKAVVYFLANDKNGQHFVLDIKGKPVLPKK